MAVSTTAISTGALGGYPENDAGDPCAKKPPPPPELPAGWVEDADWSCTCPLYVPGSKDVMPKPIEWGPCPPLPNGIECKAMVTAWSDADSPINIGDLQFDLNPDGTAVLGFRRIMATTALDLVADIDGPVRMAILRARAKDKPNGCYIITQSVNEGRYLYGAFGNDLNDKQTRDEGAIGGWIEDPKPTILTRFVNRADFSFGWAAGATWIARQSPYFVFSALSWDGSKEIFITSPATDPGGYRAHSAFVSGRAIFWHTGGPDFHGINVWDAENGARPFIRWVKDGTKEAAAFGTDGKDMVWAYSKGPVLGQVDSISVMASPYTIDPAKLKPRRLRSHPYDTIGNEFFKVGCGYAVHPWYDGTGVGTMVIRIADGSAWTVPHTPEFKYHTPIGVTCDDVFILGHIGGRWDIARVRIDSLGPAIPPD